MARCSLCGKLLLGDYTIDTEYISSIGKSEDLNRFYFQFPWLWARLYRTVYGIWDDREGDLSLSGVSLLGSWSQRALHVPRNPHNLIMGDPQDIPGELLREVAMNNVNRVKRRYATDMPRGYPMHERFWQLLTRVLNIDLITSHLRLFLQVLCRQAKQRIFNLDNLTCEESEWKRMVEDYGEDATLANPHKYIRRYEKRMECSEFEYATRDPVNIPELRDLFRNPESIQPKKKEASKGLRNAANSSIPRSHRMSLRASSTSNIRNIIVPAELVLMIMELPDVHDILSLLWVFPRWKALIPRGYWRIRCVNELVFDEDQLPDRDAFNWGYLYFNIDHLLAGSHGWRNRRRIMAILEGTKELFLKELAKQNTGV